MKKWVLLYICLAITFSLFIHPEEAKAGYSDVPRDHWAYDEIHFLSNKAVIKGYSTGKFQPLATMTRKDAAVMLVRALKINASSAPVIPSDLKPTMNGYKEMIAVTNLGMFTLTGKSFKPNNQMTRKEMAKALAVAYKYQGSGKSTFKDVSKNHPYYRFIDAIAENGITSGYSDGNFKPDVAVNRAQFSTFLARIYNEPLEYTVKSGGKTIHIARNADEAVKLAAANPNATVHPVSNSLMSYADKPAAMTETGIKNGVLIYNGVEQTNTFTADFFKPYLAYKEGETYKGSLFDSFIILGRKYSPTGEFAQTGNNHANYKEWQEYINKTFADQGALNQLNSASKSLNKKVNVYIAIPYPKQNEAITDLAGKKITNNLDSRYNLVSWYTKNVQQKWNAAGYSHLTFKGYYWLNETVINLQDEMLVEKVSKELDKQNKAFIYSPHALSTNYENWHEYGFDGAYLQPNAFRLSLTDTKARLHKAFLKSQVHGSGINLEIDTYSPHQMDAGLVNFAQYMEIAKQYNLPDQSLILYQGNDMVYRMATYNDSAYQTAYKLLYETIQ